MLILNARGKYENITYECFARRRLDLWYYRGCSSKIPYSTYTQNNSISTKLPLKKIFIFLGCIGIFAISAFFVWNQFFQNTKTELASPPIPPPTLTEVEKKYADNPANITAILSDTQAMLAGTASGNFTLEKSRLQLERATEAFYQKNIDSIALSLYKSGDAAIYREAFHKYGEVEIKADITPSTARDLKSKILSNPINPNNQDFRAYAYLLDRLNSTPKIGSG